MTNYGWEFLSSVSRQDDALLVTEKIVHFADLQLTVFVRTTGFHNCFMSHAAPGCY